jgi:predicted neuraminidase
MTHFFRTQAVFQAGALPISQCHASTLVEARDGALLAAWFGGTYEGHPDVAIWLARCQGGRWNQPVKVADVPGVSLWNPVLFRDLTGRLWLFYKVGPTVSAWTGAYIRSVDDGHTWSRPTYLPAGLLGPAKNKPITLSNGDILCGTSAETWRSWACWAEISSDGGDSWHRYGPIAITGEPGTTQQAASATWDSTAGRLILPDDHLGVIQPAVWEYAPGRLKMLMRATRRVGYICQALSDDWGRTWTSARPTDLPNPNSGLDAVRLGDGRIALVYNPTQSGRTPLAVALSEDNGQTWPQRRLLETEPGEFSYPTLIQTSDGLLNLTYTHQRTTIRHVTMAPEWVASSQF